MREDDYYTFSVRFDVLQQVHGVLMARASARGETNRRLGPEVYRAAIGEEQPDGAAS